MQMQHIRLNTSFTYLEVLLTHREVLRPVWGSKQNRKHTGSAVAIDVSGAAIALILIFFSFLLPPLPEGESDRRVV